MERNSFVFYKEWMEAIKDLPNDVRLQIYESVILYATSGCLKELDTMAKIAFNFIKTGIDRDIEKYVSIIERNKINGSKGGRPKGSSKNPEGFVQQTKNPTKPQKADNDNEYDNDIKEKDIDKSISTKKAFTPPTVDEVSFYCKERGNSILAQAFVDYYQSKNWFVGKTKMTDWRAAIRTWENKQTNAIIQKSDGGAAASSAARKQYILDKAARAVAGCSASMEFLSK